MTVGLLLDTHIALWLDSGDPRLAPTTRERIDTVWRGQGLIGVSAVTAQEVAQLVWRGRLRLDLPPDRWIQRLVGHPGLTPVPITALVAARAYMLPDLMHPDPADRLLIATAIDLGCPLVTYDERIQAFAISHGSRYGFTVIDQ